MHARIYDASTWLAQKTISLTLPHGLKWAGVYRRPIYRTKRMTACSHTHTHCSCSSHVTFIPAYPAMRVDAVGHCHLDTACSRPSTRHVPAVVISSSVFVSLVSPLAPLSWFRCMLWATATIDTAWLWRFCETRPCIYHKSKHLLLMPQDAHFLGAGVCCGPLPHRYRLAVALQRNTS